MNWLKAQGVKLTIVLLGLFVSVSTYATDESFNVSINIIAALTITEQSALVFPDTGATTSTQTVTVAPADSGAATFSVTGEPSTGIQASIVEASASLVNGGTTITIDTFTFGGGLASDGSATLDGSGNLVTDAAVGATANIPANPDTGAYSGTLTFRVLYQ